MTVEQLQLLQIEKYLYIFTFYYYCAVVAQSVEQLIRNEQVTGSNPANGSIFYIICYNNIYN